MIMVVTEQEVPKYETTCSECKSVIQYTRADVSGLRITCPVCKVSNTVYFKRVKLVKDKSGEGVNK